MPTTDNINNDKKEEFEENLQNSTVYDASAKSPIIKTHINSKLLALFLLFILAAFFLLYIAPLFFDINNIWIENASLSILAFDYMRESGNFLAPAHLNELENINYLKEYPLIFWVLYFISNAFPFIESANLLFFTFIFSLLFYAFSTYFLALTLRLNSSVALGSVCILFTSFFSLIYMQFVGFALIFAGLLNFSLAFFYRAWTRSFAPLGLLIAFILMTLAFFAGGFFALFLPLFVGIVFTTILGKPTRLAKGDGLLGAFLLFVVSGCIFILLYYYEHGEYLALLTDINNFKKAWTDTTFIAHIKHYLLFLSLSFLPYIFVFFFINQDTNSAHKRVKNSYRQEKRGLFGIFSKHDTVISAIEIPDPNEVQPQEANNNEVIEKENVMDISEIISLKQDDNAHTDIPTASFALIPENEEDNNINDKTPIKYLYSIIIVGLILISFFPYISFAHVLMLLPALSILFTKKIMQFSVRSSRIFFSIFAWTLVLIGFTSLFFAILPELRSVRPNFVAFIANSITITFAQVPKISFFIFAFIAFTLALLLLFSDKSSNWRAFARSIMAMLVLSWALNFTIYPYITFLTLHEFEENSEEIEDDINNFEINFDESEIIEKGKALLEQSETIVEEGKYFLQLPKSLMPKPFEEDKEIEEDKQKNAFDGMKPIYPLLPLPPITDDSIISPPLENFLELDSPSLQTYTL